MTRRALPLTVWAGALAGGGVAATVAATALALDQGGSTPQALAAGALAGSCLVAVVVVLAGRGAAALRALRDAAVDRLQHPSAPLDRTAGGLRLASVELADLAGVLEALHLRVRVGDQVAERHRVQAETAGAGVFELLQGLVAAEEGARGQLAAELHDTVAQSLSVARGLLAAGPTTPRQLSEVSDHVEDAEEQVRAVMARTRPPALREGDLATAVGNLRLDLRARYGLEVTLRWPDTPHPLPLATAVTVYRFFQEALLNVVKHADVDDAVAQLEVAGDVVRAVVSDLGPGFDPAGVRPERGRHVGLGLLRERARLSGGSLRVASEEGVGTTLTLELPRPPGPAAAPLDTGRVFAEP